MKLHRAKSRPDWKTINARARNFWQQLAASTGGAVTPGNVLTVIGFSVVLFGLAEITWHHYWLGIFSLILGRLGDVADGWLAEITGTKSPLGETLDATLDKISTVATILLFYVLGIVPWWVLILMLFPHLLISLITLKQLAAHIRPHPSRKGKNSMALIWLGLIGFAVLGTISSRYYSTVSTVVYSLAIMAVGTGLYAALDYAKQA